MKKVFLSVLVSFFVTTSVFSQVGINGDGSQPQSSAMLDVKSADKGFLPPRMTRAEMQNIASPVDGLVVFCSDCGAGNVGALAMFMNSQWNTLTSNCLVPVVPASGTHLASASHIEWHWNTVTGATGYKWNTFNSLAGAIDLGEATTTTKTGLACNTPYSSYVWAYNVCGNSTPTMLTKTTLANPVSPSAGTASASPTQIIWNWNPVPGATGYKWSTANVYAGATDMGAATSNTETGLNCNQMYYRYVWAYNACGYSSSKILNQLTAINPAAPVTGIHTVTSSEVVWNWNTVPGATGYKWSTINNFGTATDMGMATTKTESGLVCNSTFIRYIWAYSPCGNSAVTPLSQSTSKYPVSPVAGTHVPAVTQIVWNWEAVPGGSGYKWSTVNNYATAINVGNVLARTETGLICNTQYTRYLWSYNNCSFSPATIFAQSTLMTGVPAAPVAGNHTATSSQITWNWSTVPGASGYKWNTTDDYSSATDMGIATTRTETGLTCATSYNRYVWAYTACGVSAVTSLTKTTVWCLWICGMPVTDSRDGKIYSTVSFGSQCWMAQNLNIGLKLLHNTSEQTNNGVIEKYCMSEIESNCNIYGGLYQWDELMNYTASSNENPSGRQGICLIGWHVPSDNEWCEMETYLDPSVLCTGEHMSGVDIGGQLKEAGTVHWEAPNTGATNFSGFTALPGGTVFGILVGGFHSTAYFSTSTENSSTESWNHSLYSDYQYVGHVLLDKPWGRSVRCIRD